MTHKQAKEELQHILDNQKTVTIPRLKKLLESLNLDFGQQDEIQKGDWFTTTVSVEKTKGGKPTVIKVKGERYLMDGKSRSISKKPKGWQAKRDY